MANNYSKIFNQKNTPQNQPVHDKDQVQNNASGFVFKAGAEQQLLRFLILGSEGGTYYVNERHLTIENAQNVIALIKSNGPATVQTIVEVSTTGRAPKNDAAIFALALACAYGSNVTKSFAYNAISQVCRTGTHLFQFVDAIKSLRGWSGGLRRGVAKFYTQKDDDRLALQLVKYRQRSGWTHADVLRLSHAKPKSPEQNALFAWTVGKHDPDAAISSLVEGYEAIQALDRSDVKGAITLIKRHNLPREAVPTEFLSDKRVWEVMLSTMPITALIRNLGKMTSIGLLSSNLDASVKHVRAMLQNQDILRKGRVHPLFVLNAMKTYASGQGFRGSLSWSPVQGIVDSLDKAFYSAFGTIEPTGKNFFLGLDVSGSMGWGSTIAGMNLMPSEAAAAMAMVAARTEQNYHIHGFANTFRSLAISPTMRLDDITRVTSDMTFGATDCALPMIYAQKNKLDVDVFVVYTDNETWAGNIHPFQALENYRQKAGKDAKLIVAGMTATNFTIADPSDPGMMDVVGFDTATPEIMRQFALGNV